VGSRQRRVLVVDDDPAITAGLEALLEDAGWQVHSAESAADAVDGASFSPDIIILDVDLPDASGIDVLKQIKERWPKVPVIMISGAATIDRAVKVMKLGAETFLQKPFDSEELFQAIDAVTKAPAHRVLLVEDDDGVADALRLMLEEMGTDVRRTATAKEALAAFDDFSPHLILLDVDLPDQSGLAVLKQIKERGKSTAVIMMSGTGRIADAVTSLKIGAATFLQKPFDAATLAAAMKEVELAAASGAEAPASSAPIPCARCGVTIDRMFGACPHCHEPVTLFWRQYADQPVDGKYRLIARLGAGGMGEVYKVEHVFLRETRVIKVIRPQISAHSDAQYRFTQEAQLATTIKHPNVATLHDFSPLPDGSQYMVWEFIDGCNLAQIINGGPLSPRHAVSLTIQALEGLEAIHRAAVIHRDISPENLMITTSNTGDEHVKIIDLGIAKQEHNASVTESGVFVGKFRYASPEQLGALDAPTHIDSRSDLYSIAVVLYEMLTGNAPFEGSSPFDYILYHTRETPLPARAILRVSGSAELQQIIEHALERDRDKRYATAREFADALRAIVDSLSDLRAVFDEIAPPNPDGLTTPLPTEVPYNTLPPVDRSTKKS